MSATSSSLDLSVLADLDEDLFGSWSPTGPGAGRSTTPTPSPLVTAPIGVGTRVTTPPPLNATMGVGTTQYLRQLAD